MRLNIKELLEYFDLRGATDYGDTTATISVVGEDLGASLFRHYCQKVRGTKVEIYDPNKEIPTEGKRMGRRLDRWVIERKNDTQVLYQVEIKSWCSRAIGGIDIPVKVTDGELLEKIKNEMDIC